MRRTESRREKGRKISQNFGKTHSAKRKRKKKEE
jgi:hypothetical protein